MRVQLHVSGKDAFDAMIASIGSARKNILLNMFIWRDDVVGQRFADALLAAAHRGVKVTIHKDMLAWVFECAEENKRSLLHKPVFRLALAAKIVAWSYGPSGAPPKFSSSSRDKLLAHKHISYSEGLRYDHSKYMVVDDVTMFVGGMNFESRFETKDAFGNAWQDYVLELHDTIAVLRFLARLDGAPRDALQPLEWVLNDPRGKKPRRFEWMPMLLGGLRDAKKTVTMMMAYLGDKAVTRELCAAARRGVVVRVLIPQHANVQHDANLRVAKQLLAADAQVFFCKKMLHAKVVVIDDVAMLGSANVNKQVRKLGELDVYVRNAGEGKSVFALLHKETQRQFALAVPVKDISYSWPKAFAERFVTG